VRDDHGAGHYKDRSLTRNALRDAKIMVMPYTTYEVERDVFALARRAYEDLVRHVTDTAD
jgi:hypothetical protein